MTKTHIVGAVLLLLLGVFLGAGLASRYSDDTTSSVVETPVAEVSGEDILNAWACHPAETKTVTIKGLADDFKDGSDGPSRVHPKLKKLEGYQPSERLGRAYDELGADRTLVDYVDLTGPIAGGVFVIAVRPVGALDSDGVNFHVLRFDGSDFSIGSFGVVSFKDTQPFHISSNGTYIYKIDLNDITVPEWDAGVLQSRTSLSNALSQVSAGNVLNMVIGDDLVVDYMGLALCEQPEEQLGMTWAGDWTRVVNDQAYSHLACSHNKGQRKCDVFKGDTPCETHLPLACFVRDGTGLPKEVYSDNDVKRYWSAGQLAFTTPIEGRSLRTISDAHATCSQTFGEGWRVAGHHDSGMGFRMVAATKDPLPQSRFWMDIPDQPYATCWSR